MKLPTPSLKIYSLAFLTLCLVAPSKLRAAAYASGLTNNAGTVSFVLNESAAGVQVVWNNGANTVDLGALPKGSNTTANLGVSGVYKIIVNSSLAPGYTQTSTDTNNTSKYNSPRGVTVNMNPASPYFGRVYVANSLAGTTGGRSVGDGIYVMNADQSDALGQGNTALTAGITFTASQSDPWKIAFGKDDDLLYINNFASADCNVWAVDGNLSGAVVTNVLKGLGLTAGAGVHADAASTPIVRGSLANSNLVLVNVEGSTTSHFNQVARWNIGAGPLPWAGAQTYLAFCDRSPNNLGTAGLTTDVDVGLDGKYYTSIFRSGNDTASMKVYDTDGTTLLWSSLTTAQGMGTTNDFLQNTRAFALSYDNSLIATLHDNNSITVMKLTNGFPDLSSRFVITNSPTTISGRDISFDIAGNIYTVSSGQGLLRVQSVGGQRIATTTSDGTFTIVNPFPIVSVSPTDALASEEGPDSATFTVSRTGDLSAALDVNYTLSGTATNGVDYTNLTGTVTIPAAASSATVTITPVDDTIPEFTETVVLTLATNANYAVDIQSSASATILDNETPELSMSAFQSSAYERTPGDYLTFRITRKGKLDVDLTANVVYSGTATNTVDYNGPGTVSIAANTVNQNFKVTTIDNSDLQEANLTVIAMVDSSADYTIATNASATGTIIDDELAPETVLFSDSFASDTSADWTTLFGANNLVDDMIVTFGFDVNGDTLGSGIPAAPNGSFTVLKLTVNKNDTNAAAAGVNVYPTGHSFSGDYALRFDMYLQQNSTNGTTEFATFGINHSGTKTNWNRQSATNAANVNALPKDTDGIWYSVISDASASAPGDFCIFTSTNAANAPTLVRSTAATAFTGIFKKPPFTAAASGTPANLYGASTGKIWVNVEVKKISDIITMSINKTPIAIYTNVTPFTSGNIMLGYMDPYDSVGSTGGSVYYSNLRVVSLGSTLQTPAISSVQLINGGTQVQINFSGATSDSPSSFSVQSAAALSNSRASYSTEGGAVITEVTPGSGQFKAIVPISSSTRFYFIKR